MVRFLGRRRVRVFSSGKWRQTGAVLSPVLFCVYIDNMLKLLASAGVGCYVGSYFVGALAYADDIVILAPTATAMRRLCDLRRICTRI